MATIKEYLKYYKDLTFEECNFNINDVILFTELSYINWNNIVFDSSKKISLRKAGEKYLNSNMGYLSFFMKSNVDNLKEMLTGKRYENIYLSNYRRIIDEEKQFGALLIHLDSKTAFVSFEGTDGTVVGWKEDFVLGYHFPVMSQKCAIEYLDEVITNNIKVVFVGGHSKGGNLAMTSAMYCKDKIFKKINTIFNLDGPGFKEREYTRDFKKIIPKLKTYVPEQSIIGMLLYGSDDFKVVKSISSGIMQHDCNTWQCFGSFLVEGSLSKISIKIDKKIKDWNKKYDDDELETMITTFFSVLEDNNIKNFSEFKSLKWNQVVNIFNKVKDIDENTRKLYTEAIKELIWTNKEV